MMAMKFGSNKKLVEAVAAGLAENAAWSNGAFFRKFRKEAILGGNIDDETPAAAVTNEILNQILMGIDTYSSLDWVKQYTTDKATFSVPIGTYGVAVEISAGAFGNSPKVTSNEDFELDKEYGVEVSWTRAYLEDATWDVLSEQNQGAGYAIKKALIALCVAPIAALTTTLAGGGILDLSSAITWSEFTQLLERIDTEGTGPATDVICAPAIYWQLLRLDEFINSLYAGSDEVMRTGIAKTTLGVTVTRCYELEADAIYAVNQKKGIGLVTRRTPTVEPFQYPDENKYGFIVSTRAKAGVLVPEAIAVGETAI